MTWRILDAAGRVIAGVPSHASGEIGAFVGVTLYAGVVGYTGGAVVWTLDWAPTDVGVAPWIAFEADGKVGVFFVDPGGTEGAPSDGAHGTATLTATVDGVPAGDALTATVASAGPSIGWFDDVYDPYGTAEVNAAGTTAGGDYNFSATFYAGIVAPIPAGAYLWTVTWTPVSPVHDAFAPVVTTGVLGNYIGINPQEAPSSDLPYPGLIELTCTIDGEPVGRRLSLTVGNDSYVATETAWTSAAYAPG